MKAATPPRTAQLPVTQAEVLREAADLFCTRGYHNTRMQDIAARFGVTHAALYYHFKSKQQILEEINLTAVTGTVERAKRIAAQDAPVADRFRELLRSHVLWVAENAPLAAAVYDSDKDLSPETLQRVRKLRREFTSIVTKLYREGTELGVFAKVDSRLAVSLLLGAGNWIYRWYDNDRQNFTPDEVADSCVSLFEAGYLTGG